MSAVFRLVGLGDDAANLVTVLNQSFQRGNGKFRSTHKENPHGLHLFFHSFGSLCLFSLQIFAQFLIAQEVVHMLYIQMTI